MDGLGIYIGVIIVFYIFLVKKWWMNDINTYCSQGVQNENQKNRKIRKWSCVYFI